VFSVENEADHVYNIMNGSFMNWSVVNGSVLKGNLVDYHETQCVFTNKNVVKKSFSDTKFPQMVHFLDQYFINR